MIECREWFDGMESRRVDSRSLLRLTTLSPASGKEDFFLFSFFIPSLQSREGWRAKLVGVSQRGYIQIYVTYLNKVVTLFCQYLTIQTISQLKLNLHLYKHLYKLHDEFLWEPRLPGFWEQIEAVKRILFIGNKQNLPVGGDRFWCQLVPGVLFVIATWFDIY